MQTPYEEAVVKANNLRELRMNINVNNKNNWGGTMRHTEYESITTSVHNMMLREGSVLRVIGIGTRVTIARPFTPSLHDEIGVSPGDEVIVLQAFDDGWVQIRNVNKDVGLIPLDCSRPEGQDTAAFLASKRVSSFFQAGFLQ